MTDVNIELNFFYMHYNDARKFAEWAKSQREGDANPSIYARHAIISTVFASEALINRVLSEFAVDTAVAETLERASILEKWCVVPFVCRELAPAPLNQGEEPFQSFKELVQIRNWLAHPKVEAFVKGKAPPNSTISVSGKTEMYPWLEILTGESWKQTKIPKNPFELDHTHAEAAISVLDRMIAELSSRLSGRISKDWLEEITVRDPAGARTYKAPVCTIWGGYGGSRG